MPNSKQHIDLEKGVFLRIGGEIGKSNILPIDELVKVAGRFQDLILALARFDNESLDSIEVANFKLALSGYKTGSAVPQFRLVPLSQEVIGERSAPQRRHLNSRFQEIMGVADRGTYYDLQKMYPNATIRNAIVEPLFQFATSTGDSPMSIVEFNGSAIPSPLFKIRTFKSIVKNDLVTKIIEPKRQEKRRKDAFARIQIPEGDRPLQRNEVKIREIYGEDTHSIDYAPDTIVHEGSAYHLRYPLRCKFGFEDSYYVIHSEILDVHGTGETIDEAEECFAGEFAYLYKRLNQLEDSQMTKRAALIKANINNLVTMIE